MFKVKKNILLSLLLLAGFFITAQTGVTISDSIKSNNIYRKVRLYVPAIYNNSQAVPLLFNLHGYTSNAMQQQFYGNFMPIADTANFIMVLPEGTAPLGNQYFNAGFGPGANDLLYMSDLIDSLKLTYNIDNNRIYSCGMSNGGIMSYYLACNSSNRFAAAASVTGSMLNSWFTSAPNRPFPVMEIHGTNDATVPYNGDATFSHIDSVIKKWAKHNNCNLSPITTSVANINTTDGATAINYRYTGGNNGAEVELYKVLNGAHTWPGASFVIGTTCMDFNASVEIWRFFRKYKLNQLTTGLKEEKADHSVTLFPNPAQNEIHFNSLKENITQIEIYDILGNKILSRANETKQMTINLSELQNGVYFIHAYSNNYLLGIEKFVISR